MEKTFLHISFFLFQCGYSQRSKHYTGKISDHRSLLVEEKRVKEKQEIKKEWGKE